MNPWGGGVLVLTHPYRFFADDEGAVAAIRDEVGATDDYVVGVRPRHGHGDLDAPIGGRESYDRIVTDEDGYGRLAADDAAVIAARDPVRQGGFDRYQCVGRTGGSIREQGGQPAVDPALTGSSDGLAHFFDE
ncbi:MAG: hypothetical protein SVU88_02610 [Candidatus Nanohaloarchaea archaeon]|nr:hypothetical protein [Candidatus Nanohaloarchaea archaeon]